MPRRCLDSIAMHPHMVRIYPTLTIRDTELLNMYEEGAYKPLTLEEAVDISAVIYSHYAVNNIKVIRIGLQNSDSINEGEDVAAGPFHPAFRQLVEENIYLYSLISVLKNADIKDKHIIIHADEKLMSFLAGQKKSNINKLMEIFHLKQVSFNKTNNTDEIIIYDENKKIGSFDKSLIFQNYLDLQ
nr:hypothetical protein [Sedimentibacter sp.]